MKNVESTFACGATLAVIMASAACGSSPKQDIANTPAPSAAPSMSASAMPSASATPAPTTSGATAAEPPKATNASLVVTFDPSKGELPEGLAVHGDTTYVTMFPLCEVRKVDKSGAVSMFASIPKDPDGKCLLAGVETDKAGNVYVGRASFDPKKAKPGIYKIPAAGGDAKMFATTEGLVAPNGLDFDDKGNLYVTDSAVGVIYKVTPDGKMAKLVADPALVGDKGACDGKAPYVIGANGIGHDAEGNFWVVNTDKGALLKIPMVKGKPGKVETVMGPDCSLHGADGLVMDPVGGGIIVALNVKNQIVRIKDKTMTTIASGAPLDFPASVTFRDVEGTRTLFATNFAVMSAQMKKDPHPGIVKITP